jgi:TetR/AcrR family transcriptional regulator
MRQVPGWVAERLEAAAAVFADRGFEATRVEDLAEATGVPRATLYYYFAGKEDLLAWLLRRTLAAEAEAVTEAASGPGDAGSRLERVVRAHLGVMAANPATCRALLAESGRAGRIPEVSAAVESGFYAPLRRLLAEGAADGSLRPVEDAETVVAALYGAVTVAGLHYVLADNRLDPERVAAEVCALVIGGLQPAAVPAGGPPGGAPAGP